MNLAAKELERVAGEILERKRKEGIEVAKGYKIEAVKRERECAEKSKQLEDVRTNLVILQLGLEMTGNAPPFLLSFFAGLFDCVARPCSAASVGRSRTKCSVKSCGPRHSNWRTNGMP